MSGATLPPGGLAFKARRSKRSSTSTSSGASASSSPGSRRTSRLTPTDVTFAQSRLARSAVLLASPRYAVLGVALLILHGVLDSSDGSWPGSPARRATSGG
jgi:hypothetical protein